MRVSRTRGSLMMSVSRVTTRLDLYTCCVFALLCPVVWSVRLWKTLHMDKENQCNGFVRNDDMDEGDVYMVKSDSWEGGAPEQRRPAECAIGFNFGDRYISVRLIQWFCKENFREPFLAIYDDCLRERIDQKTNILAHYNCSVSKPVVVYSSSSCISLYHFRGHVRYGYFFALEISARHEIISFPAGGIAAIIIGSIVVVLILVKVVCVISGWEERLPDMRSQQEDQKHMLEPEDGASEVSRGRDDTTQDNIYLEAEELERPSSILLSSMAGQHKVPHAEFDDNVMSSDDAASGEYDNLSPSWRDSPSHNTNSWKL